MSNDIRTKTLDSLSQSHYVRLVGHREQSADTRSRGFL